MANATTWKSRVARWRASGLTAREFAAGKDYSPKTLTWWASRLKRAPQGGSGSSDVAVRLARVWIEGDEHVQRGPQAAPPKGDSDGEGAPAVAAQGGRGQRAGITLEVGGAVVALDVGFDTETLRSALEVLGSWGGCR